MAVLDLTPAHTKTDPATPEQPEAQSLRRLMSALGRTWKIPAFAAVIGALALLGLTIFLRTALPTTTTYLARVALVFPGADKGKYPNGSTFSLNEIIEPSVLSEVYDSLNVAQYGIKREEFMEGMTVRPSGATEAEIADRFRQELADRRLTFTERERLESQLRAQLDSAARATAEIAWTVRRRLPIPEEVGRQIVQTVPLIWSRNAIQKKGALNFPGFQASTSVIDMDLPKEYSLPLAIVMITVADQRIAKRLSDLRENPGVLGTLEPQTGMSLRDIERDVADLRFIYVNYLTEALVRYRFPDSVGGGFSRTEMVIGRTLRELEQNLAESEKLLQALSNTTNQYVESVVNLKGRSADSRSSTTEPGGTRAGGMMIPQFGETFIDKIIELSRQGRNSEQDFIAEMTRKQLDVNERIVTLRAQHERWKDLLDTLRVNSTAREAADEATIRNLTKELQTAAAKLNEKWAALTRLESEFANNQVSQTGKLYAALGLRQDVFTADPVWNARIILMSISLGLLILLFIWGILALSTLWRDAASNDAKGSTSSSQ